MRTVHFPIKATQNAKIIWGKIPKDIKLKILNNPG